MIDEYVKMGYWDNNLVSDYWDQHALSRPDALAIVEEGSSITWKEIKRQTDSIAACLIDLNIKRDERVAIQLYNCVELFTFRLACEKAGIVAVTLLPNFRQTEVGAILKHTGSVGIVIPFEFRGFNYWRMIREIKTDLPSLRHIFVIGDDVPEGAVSAKEITNKPVDDRHTDLNNVFKERRFSAFETFQIATTTGTTGMPKCSEFASCVRQATGRVVAKRLKITKKDIVGAFAPVIAGGCFNEIYRACPIVGARIVLARYFTPEEILTLIEREKVTIIATVATVLIRMLDYPDFEKYNTSSLRIVKHGGAPISYNQALRVWEKFNRPVLPAYGGLDAGTISSSSIDDTRENLLKTVGRPLDGAIIKLVDENNDEVAQGEVGEILVKGPHCEPGYFGDPEATKETWQDGWFHTGDLASLDAEGRITIKGRRKDMIIRGGQNIYPLEIENMLLMHPTVLKAAVVGMPDAEMGEKACAYVVLKEGDKLSLQDMICFMKDRGIAPFKIPERLEFIDDIPLVGGIKIDKAHLKSDIETKLRQEGILK